MSLQIYQIKKHTIIIHDIGWLPLKFCKFRIIHRRHTFLRLLPKLQENQIAPEKKYREEKKIGDGAAKSSPAPVGRRRRSAWRGGAVAGEKTRQCGLPRLPLLPRCNLTRALASPWPACICC